MGSIAGYATVERIGKRVDSPERVGEAHSPLLWPWCSPRLAAQVIRAHVNTAGDARVPRMCRPEGEKGSGREARAERKQSTHVSAYSVGRASVCAKKSRLGGVVELACSRGMRRRPGCAAWQGAHQPAPHPSSNQFPSGRALVPLPHACGQGVNASRRGLQAGWQAAAGQQRAATDCRRM